MATYLDRTRRVSPFGIALMDVSFQMVSLRQVRAVMPGTYLKGKQSRLVQARSGSSLRLVETRRDSFREQRTDRKEIEQNSVFRRVIKDPAF
jgi:hypothetical protein